VLSLLADEMGFKAASMRVMERTVIVLQDAFEGGNPIDMAQALRSRRNPPT
jgi:hypothetical protein